MKKITFFMAACALGAAVSCSQNEAQDVMAAAEAENAIGFLSNTTRADVLTLADLKGDADGFVVLGTKANSGVWDALMDGTSNYSYASGNWVWDVTSDDQLPKWPTEANQYPIKFYAYYPTAIAGAMSVKSDTEADLAITYDAPTAGQHDILVATNSTETRPVGDKLPLHFKHLLSKITFNVTPGGDNVVFTQAIGLAQVCSKRQYTIASNTWGAQSAADIKDYSFLDTKNPAFDSSNKKAPIVGTNGDLMMLPQSTTSWDPEGMTAGATAADGSHIYMLYRVETALGGDLIGYQAAKNHPDYDEDTDSALADKILFVKVGYPVGDPTFNLESGMSYNYNIKIATEGATNGYLLSKNYFDENGVETKFPIDGKEIGDPVSDGYINFDVYVDEWIEKSVDFE